MADPFENGFAQQAFEDPAADFLAQQENEIAGMENEVLGQFEEAPNVNGVNEGVTDSFGDAVVSQTNDGFGFEANETHLVTDQGDAGDVDVETMDPSQAYAAIAAADSRLEQLRLEPEKIRLWREEYTKLLAEKDRESERKQQEWIAQARKELEDWDRNRQEQLEKTKANNRTAEAQFVKERDNHTPGSEWDRVSKLCDFNPKMSKGSKDLTRMRSTLLHLKQNPRPVSVTVPGSE